jgi:hypothetical protein
MLLDEKQVVETLHEILRDLARRHRNITQTFYKHCKEIKGLIELGNSKTNRLVYR